jgi:RNA polymerase sigma factor (sigma-70 family)
VTKKRETSRITSAFLSLERGLKQYLMRFLVRPEDIEDAVQETFLRAYESERSGEIRSPDSFLFKVAKNLALSELSRKTNRMAVYMGDLEELNVIDYRLPLEETLDVQQKLFVVCKAIESLPPQCQRVFVMRKVFGFSHKEVARRLGISVRTVEKHLTKGLQRCQEFMRSDDVAQNYNTPFGTEKLK